MAHCLSASAASVWERCDGRLSHAEIAQQLGLEPAAVQRAVDELRGCGLLEDGPVLGLGYSRREATVRFAKVGGAAFAAPLIYSVGIGSAAAAASVCTPNNGAASAACTAGGVGTKGTDSKCCSSTCYNKGGTGKICVPAGCGVGLLGCLLNSNCCSGSCVLLICVN